MVKLVCNTECEEEQGVRRRGSDLSYTSSILKVVYLMRNMKKPQEIPMKNTGTSPRIGILLITIEGLHFTFYYYLVYEGSKNVLRNERNREVHN